MTRTMLPWTLTMVLTGCSGVAVEEEGEGGGGGETTTTTTTTTNHHHHDDLELGHGRQRGIHVEQQLGHRRSGGRDLRDAAAGLFRQLRRGAQLPVRHHGLV